MCKPASMVVTKEKIFWSEKSDSHEDTISEFGLVEKVANQLTFVRIEIVPPNENDFGASSSKWKFNDNNSLSSRTAHIRLLRSFL